MRLAVEASSKTSLARALDLLKVILDAREARVDELAKATRMPTSTVYRYIRDLRSAGLVLEDGGVYRLGPVLHLFNAALPSATELRQVAHPTLEELAERSGETAILAIRSHARAACLDQVESQHAVRMAFRIGQPLPLYAGASTRVLLAYAPDEVVQTVLSQIERHTDATPEAEQLKEQLVAIRRDEIASSSGEFVPGAYAVAVPVLVDNRCVCAVSVAAPSKRATDEWREQAPTLLSDARHSIETLVG